MPWPGATLDLCMLLSLAVVSPQSDSLWGCLAGMATVARELETAEIAYSSIDQADKVEYLRYIKVRSRSGCYAPILSVTLWN